MVLFPPRGFLEFVLPVGRFSSHFSVFSHVERNTHKQISIVHRCEELFVPMWPCDKLVTRPGCYPTFSPKLQQPTTLCAGEAVIDISLH